MPSRTPPTSVIMEPEILALYRLAAEESKENPCGPQYDVSKLVRWAMRNAAKEWGWLKEEKPKTEEPPK